MAKFINESGSVLTSWEHGWTVGPEGELDWPDYDPETHGATPGLRLLDPPKRRAAAQPKTGDSAGDTGASNPDAAAGENSDPAGPDGTSAADAAGEENPT